MPQPLIVNIHININIRTQKISQGSNNDCRLWLGDEIETVIKMERGGRFEIIKAKDYPCFVLFSQTTQKYTRGFKIFPVLFFFF